MRFSHIIIYVSDVTKTAEFYQKAFNVDIGFICDDNLYVEMNTGETKLAFVSETIAKENGLDFHQNTSGNGKAPGCEITFMTEDVTNAFDIAVAAGAQAVSPPEEKPWGQTVAYVKDCNGFLVEIGNSVNIHKDS